MKTSSIASVALKVLAVYLVLQFLAFLPSVLTIANLRSSERSVMDSSLNLSLIVYAITAVFYLVFAMLLFRKAHKIGPLFANDPDEELSLSGALSAGVLALTFRCLGAYALITWLPPLVLSISRAVITIVRSPEPVPWEYTFFWMQVVTPLTGCAVGILLLLRTEAIIRLGKFSRERPEDEEG